MWWWSLHHAFGRGPFPARSCSRAFEPPPSMRIGRLATVWKSPALSRRWSSLWPAVSPRSTSCKVMGCRPCVRGQMLYEIACRRPSGKSRSGTRDWLAPPLKSDRTPGLTEGAGGVVHPGSGSRCPHFDGAIRKWRVPPKCLIGMGQGCSGLAYASAAARGLAIRLAIKQGELRRRPPTTWIGDPARRHCTWQSGPVGQPRPASGAGAPIGFYE